MGVALGLLLVACGDGSDPELGGPTDVDDAASAEVAEESASSASDEERASVVATTAILGDVLDNLLDGEADVEVIIPPGADPHGFEPSASDGQLLREADVVVANGLDLEEQLLTALEAAEEEGVRVFTLADKLDPIDFDWDGPGHDHADDDHADDDHADDDHAHEDDDHADDDHAHELDPHVWFDPVRMADGVALIAAELAEHSDALDEDLLMSRAAAYGQQLEALDERISGWFDTIPEGNRQLVTNHDALGYFAARYDFEVVGTVLPGSSTQVEQDPAGFARLIESVETAGVPAVFAETTDSTVLAEQLQSEVAARTDLDLEVVEIYTGALGEPGSGAETYLGLLETTSALITEALGGRTG